MRSRPPCLTPNLRLSDALPTQGIRMRKTQ
jgi:hypothetical protein